MAKKSAKHGSNEWKQHLKDSWTPEKRAAASARQKERMRVKEIRQRQSDAWTPEMREAASDRMSGTTRLEETKKKIRDFWDQEARDKQSKRRKGTVSAFKGKHHTEEAKQKNREAHKGKPAWNKGKKGLKLTQEHKQHISDGLVIWWKELPDEIKSERNKKISESRKIFYQTHPIESLPHIRYMGQYYIRSNGQIVWLRSSYEIRVAKMLDYFGVTWEYEPKSFDIGGHYYHPDFYLTEYNLWWEVKGWLNDKDREKLNKFYNIYLDETLKLVFIDDIKLLEQYKTISNEDIINFGKDMCDFTL